MIEIFKNNRLNRTQGMSLVEVLFALGVLTVLITTLVAVLTRALSESDFARNQALANNYLKEGLELARSARDQTLWASFQSVSASPLPSPFSRTITITSESEEVKRLDVRVFWSDSKGTHDATASTYLKRW